MPGLTFRSVFVAGSAPVRMPHWRKLLLVVCLMTLGEPLLADVTGASPIESIAASGNKDNAILSGMDITRKVLGGDASERNDWPSVIALARPGESPLRDRFFCGGTIIAKRWVMTAAHCLFNAFGRQDSPSSIRVIAGIHDLVEDASLDEVYVTNVIVHPDYDNSLESPPGDIALLELATELEAPLGQLFVGESEDYSDTIGFIVGWGATRYINENSAEYPTIQQEASVPLVSLATCNSPISYGGIIAVTQLCAGYAAGQIDTCAGDSGGPLYIIEDGQVIQVGITSFGNGCGQENFYGIYTNVSRYIPWLGNYVPVPEQSPELIATREAEANGESSNNAGKTSGGAMHPLYLLLLFTASLVRRSDRSRFSLENAKLWRSWPARKSLLVAPMALLVSACTVPSIGAQASSTNAAELPSEEKNRMLEAHALLLNGDSVRTGIDGLQLGMTHANLVSHLTETHWQKPVCKSGKTAMRGTGRLFQTGHCSVNAAGKVRLHGWQVHKLDFFLLDQQLVRIDVALAGSLTGSLTGSGSLASDGDTDLSDLLDDTYRHAGTALPGTGHESAWLWRHQDDQIRLYPGQSLQFTDGRLESGLPALYDFLPPFDVD